MRFEVWPGKENSSAVLDFIRLITAADFARLAAAAGTAARSDAAVAAAAEAAEDTHSAGDAGGDRKLLQQQGRSLQQEGNTAAWALEETIPRAYFWKGARCCPVPTVCLHARQHVRWLFNLPV